MARKRRRNPWTTTEMQMLQRLHAGGAMPSVADLVARFPRHSQGGIQTVACRLGLRTVDHEQMHLERAQAYLARRGPALLAYLGVAIPEAAE